MSARARHRAALAIGLALGVSALLGWTIHRALRPERLAPRRHAEAVDRLRAEMERVASQPRPASSPLRADWIATARASRRADPADLPAPWIPSLAPGRVRSGSGHDAAGAGARP